MLTETRVNKAPIDALAAFLIEDKQGVKAAAVANRAAWVRESSRVQQNFRASTQEYEAAVQARRNTDDRIGAQVYHEFTERQRREYFAESEAASKILDEYAQVASAKNPGEDSLSVRIHAARAVIYDLHALRQKTQGPRIPAPRRGE